MKAPDKFAAMYDAHERGDVKAVRKLLKAHPDLEAMGPNSNMLTWLHFAAQKGHIPLAEFWLEHGLDVNRNLRGLSPEKDGLSAPLHFAKDAAMTRYLLSRSKIGVSSFFFTTGFRLGRIVKMARKKN